MHNPYNANLQVSAKEMARVGQTMAQRLNEAKGPTAVMIPLRGWSVYGAPGGPLHDPLAYKAFLKALRTHLRPNIQYREVDAHINDGLFAELCVNQLKAFMEPQGSQRNTLCPQKGR
jgi:uncharacterized protein (UPF0261 family)